MRPDLRRCGRPEPTRLGSGRFRARPAGSEHIRPVPSTCGQFCFANVIQISLFKKLLRAWEIETHFSVAVQLPQRGAYAEVNYNLPSIHYKDIFCSDRALLILKELLDVRPNFDRIRPNISPQNTGHFDQQIFSLEHCCSRVVGINTGLDSNRIHFSAPISLSSTKTHSVGLGSQQ